jgi:hypothetical protein
MHRFLKGELRGGVHTFMLFALLGPRFWGTIAADTLAASAMLPYDLSMLDRVPDKTQSTGPPVEDLGDAMAMAEHLKPTKIAA